MRIPKLLLLLSLIAVFPQPASSTGQACGTSIHGGNVVANAYAGKSADNSGNTTAACEEAKANAMIKMGVVAPTCAGCPGGADGCSSSTYIPHPEYMSWGACQWNAGCNCVVVSVVVTQSMSWDQLCSSCPP